MPDQVPVPTDEFCVKSADGKHAWGYEPKYTPDFDLVGALIVCQHCGYVIDDVPNIPAEKEKEWEELGRKLEAEEKLPVPRFRPPGIL
jgi:hypothetical protein